VPRRIPVAAGSLLRVRRAPVRAGCDEGTRFPTYCAPWRKRDRCERGKQFPLSFAPVSGHCCQNAEIIVRCIVPRIHGQKVLKPCTRLRVALSGEGRYRPAVPRRACTTAQVPARPELQWRCPLFYGSVREQICRSAIAEHLAPVIVEAEVAIQRLEQIGTAGEVAGVVVRSIPEAEVESEIHPPEIGRVRPVQH
jgi:hypothetical protein